MINKVTCHYCNNMLNIVSASANCYDCKVNYYYYSVRSNEDFNIVFQGVYTYFEENVSAEDMLFRSYEIPLRMIVNLTLKNDKLIFNHGVITNKNNPLNENIKIDEIIDFDKKSIKDMRQLIYAYKLLL